MIAEQLSSLLRGMGPALANHLWQSTVFAAAAWLMTLLLRRNRAQVRHGLWLAASVKFLIPLSLLVGLGGFLPKPQHFAISPQIALYSALDVASQPFSEMTMPPVPSTAHTARWMERFAAWLPVLLAAVWLCGVVTVLLVWFARWRQVSATLRRAVSVAQGREVEILRRFERRANIRRRIPLLLSGELMEPGIFGIFRPVLLWPQRLSERLEDEHIEAILAHELIHARRHDNLTAALHMLVEAAFWFHPLLWWMEGRMVEERERACDEAVVQMGGRPDAYAESLLKACRFCIESPLACVSGITGADLNRRIVSIVTKGLGDKLGLGRKLLLAAIGIAAVAGPLVFGQVNAVLRMAILAPLPPAPPPPPPPPPRFMIAAAPIGAAAQIAAHASSAMPSAFDVVTIKPSKNIAATWQGTLHMNRDLRIVVKITKAGDGTLRATYYNIDGTPGGIPAISSTLNGSSLKLDLPLGTYEGTVSADGNSITGTWKQGPNPLPLNFARATPETEWTIPQPPPRLPPMAADANPTFEVATIKPSRPDEHGPRFSFDPRRFSVIHISLSQLVQFSYGLQQRQIAGAPDWFTSESYDISAEPGGEGEPNIKQWQSMVKKLMADRFQLKFHYEKRELTVYALTIAKTGPKLTRSHGDPSGSAGLGFGPPGNFGATNATMADIAEAMQQDALDAPVVDQTGLTGRFDLRLTWTPDEMQSATESADAPPDLFTAIQEELGLKLVSTKAPVDVLVVDHVEQPTPN